MPYESEYLSGLTHRLEMEGREHLTVSGVENGSAVAQGVLHIVGHHDDGDALFTI